MKRNLVLMSLFVAVMLTAAALPASAQVTYQIFSVPTFVINNGRSEVMGSVLLRATNSTPTLATSFDFQAKNVPCDNNAATGIIVVGTGVFAAVPVVTAVTNLVSGCVVTVSLPGGITPAIGDQITLSGWRGRIDIAAPPIGGGFSNGVDIEASLNATPSTNSFFTAPTIVRIATTQDGILAAFRQGLQLLCLAPGLPGPSPRVQVTEAFAGAAVQHVTEFGGLAVPGDARPGFGGTNNTRIRIVVANVPAGVTLTWPAVVFDAVAGAGQLNRDTSATATSLTQTYSFHTTSQFTSDLNTEVFNIIPLVGLPGAPPVVLTIATATVRLHPDLTTGDLTATSTSPPLGTAQPRPRFFNRILGPGSILQITPCTTNLLFPWVTNFTTAGGGANSNFDTGIAIANTSLDVYGTGPQNGQSCRLHLFPTSGTAPVPRTVTLGPINGGRVGTLIMSGQAAFAKESGYIIAVCDFQYAHGFAFITDNFAIGNANTAQGYLALVIPDPQIIGGLVALPAFRPASNSDVLSILLTLAGFPPLGESLGN